MVLAELSSETTERSHATLLCLRLIAARRALQRGPRPRIWPVRPIRAIIPFGAGSATDMVPRIVFDQLSASLASRSSWRTAAAPAARIGTARSRRPIPTATRCWSHSSAHTITPAIYPNLSYDAARDFAAVGAIGSVPMC